VDYEEIFSLAKPYLEKNYFGVAHTRRVFNIAKKSFSIPKELKELTITAIILHDIGGSSIRDQYEKGPEIASSILEKIGRKKEFINEVCELIKTHHNHPENPTTPFRILYDADKLAMFSPEEFSFYDKKEDMDWNKIIQLIYSQKGKSLATEKFKNMKS
jgi:HD superfamily phosphohydrolase YqeK